MVRRGHDTGAAGGCNGERRLDATGFERAFLTCVLAPPCWAATSSADMSPAATALAVAASFSADFALFTAAPTALVSCAAGWLLCSSASAPAGAEADLSEADFFFLPLFSSAAAGAAAGEAASAAAAADDLREDPKTMAAAMRVCRWAPFSDSSLMSRRFPLLSVLWSSNRSLIGTDRI